MPHKLLIVDDDASIRNVLKESLENEEYDVATAKDAFAAIEYLKENKVDLIISDLMMPEMTGSELLQKIRKDGYSTGFLMITAYG
ncbi:MAG: response regulator, partial [Candidatus Marinimicrobia bacterium]|nr:response regulator [Candidatus Neomarinimicrobiota bacterium]